MRSMKRPSRRLRESVATMLKNGRFLAPPRAKRITTIIIPKSCAGRKKPTIIARYAAQQQALMTTGRAHREESSIIADFGPDRQLHRSRIGRKSHAESFKLTDTACFPALMTLIQCPRR